MHEQFEITGYTMYKKTENGVDTVFRASELFWGKEWYDFAFIKYDDGLYPTKLLGFIQYTKGELPYGMDRETTYAVVHCSDSRFDVDGLKREFVRGFELGVQDTSYDIVLVSAIAIPNYGHEKGTKYITVLAYKDWGSYFRRKMIVIDEADSLDRNNGSHWVKYIKY